MFGTYRDAINIINSILETHLNKAHKAKKHGNPDYCHALICAREAIQLAWDEEEAAFHSWAEKEQLNLDNFDVKYEIEQ